MKIYIPKLVEGTDDQYKIYTDNRGTMLCDLRLVRAELAEANKRIELLADCNLEHKGLIEVRFLYEERAKSAVLVEALSEIAVAPCSPDSTMMNLWIDKAKQSAREAIKKYGESK